MVDNLRQLTGVNRGSAMVIVTVAVVVLVSFSSLVVDMGHLFLVRHRLSNALDAAVLAAGQELPDGYGGAPAVAEAYFNSNGVESAVLSSVNISDDRRTVTASGYVNVNYFLAGVLGMTSTTVDGTAAARISPVTRVRGVVPVGIDKPPDDQPLQFGQEYTLKVSSNNDAAQILGPGNFGVLDIRGNQDSPGGGSSEWLEDFQQGYQGLVQVGDVIVTVTGNRSGPAIDGVEYRIQQCTHACIYSDFNPGCPRVIIIPVYVPENTDKDKVKSVRVTGFAAFLLTDYTGSGNKSYIKGRFLQLVVEGEGDSESVEDFGCYAVKLIV